MTPLERAHLSFFGLALGDSFGETFFTPGAVPRLAARSLAPAPWPWTDDTLMASSVVSTLATHGRIDPTALASSFAARYDPTRGYGSSMHGHLTRLALLGPEHWETEAQALFNGSGSFGNGAAMRVAPLGAFFADHLANDPGHLLVQAELSARVTHAHPDAIHGAAAVSLAAALLWNTRSDPAPPPPDLLTTVAGYLAAGAVRSAIELAASLPAGTSAPAAARILGNGAKASALDTVPFSLWCAAHHLDSYEQALWATVSAFGDRDTTCAIVGGLVVLRTGIDSLPLLWRQRAESLAVLLDPDHP